MADPADVAALFDKLSGLTSKQDHKKTLKVVDQILKISPHDEDAIRCKVVALLQLSQFEEALNAITGSRLSAQLLWEQSYCLYRLSKFTEALSTVQTVPADDPRRLELEAQLHYKLGNNKECINTYDKLFQVNKAPSQDLKANVLAAYVAAGLAKEVVKLMSSMKITSKQSFEIGYNKACGLLELGQYAAAESELKQAFRLARETLLDEDLPEEVVEEESAPLLVQLGYVLARTGRLDEAVAQYDAVLKGGNADEVTAAVAAVNAVADGIKAHTSAHHKKHFSNALKKLDALTDKGQSGTQLLPALELGLSAGQKRAIHLNRGLLAVMAGRLEQASAIAQQLGRQHPTSGPVALLGASVLAKSGKAPEADALLAAFTAKKPAASHPAVLMRAQLALEAGNPQAAIQLLSTLQDPELAAAPALLATRCALHEQAGDVAGAEALLQSALAALQQRSGAGGAAQCLQSLVDLKLRLGKAPEAAQAYQQLRSLGADPSASAQVLAKLARVTAALDPALTASYAADLPPAARCSAEELDALEESQRSSSSVPAKVSKKRDAEGGSGMEPKTKKRKKKKARFPKGFDPEHPGPPPDPERWLPKWQRSDFKKKNRRRRDKDVKGSQGAGKVDENLDRNKPMEVDAPKAPAPAPKGRGKGKGKR